MGKGRRRWVNQTAAQTCRKVEVNSVTGHVLRIDPRRSRRSAATSYEVPCEADARTSAAWSYGPKCKSQTTGADRIQQSAPSM